MIINMEDHVQYLTTTKGYLDDYTRNMECEFIRCYIHRWHGNLYCKYPHNFYVYK